MNLNHLGVAAGIGGFLGFVVGVLYSPEIGAITASVVFVVLAGGLLLRSRPRIATPRPRRHDAGSPRIDSVNLAANQHFPASQPPPELRGFIDRQTENHRDALRTIEDRLRANDRVIVHGEGGLGKSVIAYQATALVHVQAGELEDMRWMVRKVA